MFARGIVLLITLVFALSLQGQQKIALRDEIVIGQNYFFDFGPPFNFFEIYVLRANGGQTEVDRLSLTPPATSCTAHTTYAHEHASLAIPFRSVLQGKDPCVITDKQILREAKRKRGLQFSGALLNMRLTCGGKQRLIPMQLLEEDLFSVYPKPPPGASWSIAVLGTLTSAFKGNVMERPMFSLENATKSSEQPLQQGEMELALKAGKYDDLFTSPSHLLSRMYLESLQPEIPSSATVTSSVTAIRAPLPAYPPIARAAHVAGSVRMKGMVGGDGKLHDLLTLEGPNLLVSASSTALNSWAFSPEHVGKTVEVTFTLKLNCTTQERDKDLPR